jgi:putative oxidoreductase
VDNCYASLLNELYFYFTVNETLNNISMKKLLSTNYSTGAFNTATLFLRLAVGVLMIHNHGYDKLMNFSTYKEHFPSFLGLGSSVSLSLDIFAECFCSMFLIIGLFTRFAVIPLIIAMVAAVMMAHGGEFFGKPGELAVHYLAAYIVLLLIGPGRISVDSMIGK